ncbi:hypothetical protein ACSBR2_030332 [Camellia fascicularis]
MSISYNIFISLVFSCNQTGVRGYYDLVNNGKILVSDSSFEPQRFSKVDFEVDSDANGEVVGNSVDVEYRAGDENGMGGNSVEELFQQNQDDKVTQVLSGKEMIPVDEPQAPVDKPYLNQEFESEAEAHAFYNAYATRVGFVIRVSKLSRSRHDGSAIETGFED